MWLFLFQNYRFKDNLELIICHKWMNNDTSDFQSFRCKNLLAEFQAFNVISSKLTKQNDKILK